MSEVNLLQSNTTSDDFFPIIGIGASAGGLESFEKLFSSISDDVNMSFVIVQHLDPNHESILVDLLSRYTKLPVSQVVDGVKVEPNHIYIIPPDRDMALLNGELHLLEPSKPRGLRLSIDYFFRSLAKDLSYRAIGIILSGTGSDGSLGVRAIKEVGGMSIAQKPETAKYSGMPLNAISTGVVDLILEPENIPSALEYYVSQTLSVDAQNKKQILQHLTMLLHKVFILLRDHTGHDFSAYKPTTIFRRVERRMTVNQIEELEDYIRFLQHDKTEIATLFKELLIGVTSFFRDRDAFDTLAEIIIEQIMRNREPDENIRVWVPACSTGEEAYSLSMILNDKMDEIGRYFDIQIFATDIDLRAVEKARTGIYPDNIAADVPPAYLKRYFEHVNNHYRVSKQIRSSIIFAQHSVTKDPPFSHVDLISCRNLLIYLNPEVQQDVIRMFHYALKSGGYLFLSNSENLSQSAHLYEPIEKRWKIFRKLNDDLLPRTRFKFTAFAKDQRNPQQLTSQKPLKYNTIAEQALIARYGQPAVIVDDQGEILYFHGDTSPYLRPASGEASFNILRMARDGIRMSLTTALRKVILQRQEIIYENLQIKFKENVLVCNLILSPIERPPNASQISIIIFERLDDLSYEIIEQASQPPFNDQDQQRILELEQELHSTREYLQATIEELEASNEDLKSTNEELQSSNEELQSTNEELETAKEELQSVNEELITVNSELSHKMDEISQKTNDQINLLNRVEVGIVFLNLELELQLFNPIASELLNLIETDIGRSLGHFSSNFDYPDLSTQLELVIQTLQPSKYEVHTQNGKWYLMRIYPYRTIHGAMDGVVVTFSDITDQKQIQKNLETRENILASLVKNLDYSGILVYDRDLRYVFAEGKSLEESGFVPKDLIGQSLYEILPKERADRLAEFYKRGLNGEKVQFDSVFANTDYISFTAPVRNVNNEIIYGMILITSNED